MNSKLRFYLRGLGIGIVVTALILTAVNLKNNRGEMTDAEVKQRAAELGMVEGNSYSLVDATSGQDKTEETTEEKVEEKTEDKTEEKTEDTEEQSEETTVENIDEVTEIKAEEEVTEEQVTEEQAAEEVKEETSQPETKEEAKAEEPAEEVNEEPVQTPATGEAITISIHSGAASETAAAILKNAGLITDAVDFNAYMIQNGYDRRIHPGTYTITQGATYEEICKIIAG